MSITLEKIIASIKNIVKTLIQNRRTVMAIKFDGECHHVVGFIPFDYLPVMVQIHDDVSGSTETNINIPRYHL